MNVLVACEESQRVATAFREQGHNAFSCDIIPCSGGHSEYHIISDVLKIINGNCDFQTENGEKHTIKTTWDLIIAHPPCTYLTYAANSWHKLGIKSLDEINERTLKRVYAMQFFMNIAMADCEKIAIENPVGIMNTAYRKPDCMIHPYQFSEGPEDTENYVTKRTCLWLKGLSPLVPSKVIEKPNNRALFGFSSTTGKAYCWNDRITKDRAKTRSKTFPAIAAAMAKQWG